MLMEGVSTGPVNIDSVVQMLAYLEAEFTVTATE